MSKIRGQAPEEETMAAYTSEGASDVQWYPNGPNEVFKAVKEYLAAKNIRPKACDDRALRIDANLGMAAFTGSVIASIAVAPGPDNGSNLRFSGRMGVFSQGNIGAQRRIEKERTDLFSQVAARLPAVTRPAHTTSTTQADNPAEQLAKVAELFNAGVLSAEEFAAAKAKILG